MSVLCQKNLSINVGAACAFVQDSASDSFAVNGGFAYSPQRQEILAVSFGGSAFYPITALARVGGTKVALGATGRGVGWCPSVSKYYITINGSVIRPYNPATSTFDANIALPGNGDAVVYVASTDRIYTICGGRFLVEINPHTNTPSTVFTGAAPDDYGYQIDYASSINAIVGRLNRTSTTTLFGWVFSLPGNTMALTPAVASLAANTAEGSTWDSTRGKIWMNIVGAPNLETFLRVDPTTGLETQVQQGNASGAAYIAYDAGSDCIYFNEVSTFDGVSRIYKLKADASVLPTTLSDSAFTYESNVAVLVANTLFFTGALRNADSVRATRSCPVSQFP